MAIPWVNTPPTPKTPAPAKKPVPAATFPVTLDKSAVSTTVKRPKPSRSQQEKDEEEEVLVVDGIEFDSHLCVKFDVYINAPDPGGIGPDCSEYAGSFFNVPHMKRTDGSMMVNTKLRLGITDLIDALNVDGDESVIVTLMPRMGTVTIGGVHIELSA